MDSRRQFQMAAVGFVLLVVALAIYLSKEFITTVLLSIFFAYMLDPVYTRLHRITGRRALSSAISVVLVFLALMIVIFGVLDMLASEVSRLMEIEDLLDVDLSAYPETIQSMALQYLPSGISPNLEKIRTVSETNAISLVRYALSHVEGALSDLLSALPIRMAQLLLAIFLTYYLLMDGRSILGLAFRHLPEKGTLAIFLHELDNIYNSLFHVYFITSMLSGFLAALGFILLGIPYSLLWGAIVAILTLLPMLGPPIVFVPMSLYYLLSGDLLRGIILPIFGFIFLMVIPENVLRPHLAMKGASIHPVITILAYTAPIFVIGMIGVIIGPAIYGFILAAYRTALRIQEPLSAEM